jgi:glycyl-tRNA synthetase beta chain
LTETETRLPLRAVFDAAFAAYGMTDAPVDDLLGFVADRLKVHLHGQEISHDVVSAVFALGSDDVVELAGRAAGLRDFLNGEDGANLKAAYMRANGICSKAGHDAAQIDESLLQDAAEKALFAALQTVSDAAVDALDDYLAFLDRLATLRAPVDAFFEAVMVNDDDEKIRHNRLSLLQALVQQMRRAADFDLIE